MKYRLFVNILVAWSILFFAAKTLAQSSDDSDSVQQVRMLTGSNQLSHVQEKLIPQLTVIYSATTNTSEKLQILNCIAENSIIQNGISDGDRYLLLKYATGEYASLESSNKTSVWATDILGRFVKRERSDIYKAYALTNLIVLQVLGRDQRAAKNTLEDLLRLTRSSQDPQIAKQRATILIVAFEKFSEGIDNPEDQAAWLERLQHSMQDTNNSAEERWIFTMALGDAYSDDGTEDKVKAGKALFLQAMQETTNSEQKLECLNMISYFRFQLADYPGAVADVEQMIPMVSSLPSETKASGAQILGKAVSSVQNAFRKEQKWNRLIEIRKMVLDLAGSHLPPDEQYNYTAENGNDAKMVGDTKSAVAWYNTAFELFPNSGYDRSDIVNLEIERSNVYALTSHLERIEKFEAIWAKYGTNEWVTTYNLGVNLAYEYAAVKDKNGKQFFSDLLDRMDSHRPQDGSPQAPLYGVIEESCLIKLALWYMEDHENDKMIATSRKYLAKYPNGNNATAARQMIASASATGGVVPPSVESKARRAIILVVLALLTVVPLIVIMTRKMAYSNKSV